MPFLSVTLLFYQPFINDYGLMYWLHLRIELLKKEMWI